MRYLEASAVVAAPVLLIQGSIAVGVKVNGGCGKCLSGIAIALNVLAWLIFVVYLMFFISDVTGHKIG